MTFIVLEGADGVGKSTQVTKLVERLVGIGKDVLQTHEPGGTPAGQEIRKRLLHAESLDPEAELALMLEDRAHHVAEVIKPALAAGTIIICDRFTPSSLVYQGIARKLGVEHVETAAAEAEQGVVPDLVLVLDLQDELLDPRQSKDPDRLEREGKDFQQAVRDGYRMLAGLYGWKVVDASGRPEEVFERVYHEVRLVLP